MKHVSITMKLLLILLFSVICVFAENFTESDEDYCPCECDVEKNSICGSDSKWYSPCTLECAQCENPDSDLFEEHPDHCETENPDGGEQTGENNGARAHYHRHHKGPPKHLQRHHTEVATTGQPEAYNGTVTAEPEVVEARADSICQCICTQELGTICGTDGRWYTACTLKCEQCKHPENNVTFTDASFCQKNLKNTQKPKRGGGYGKKKEWRPKWLKKIGDGIRHIWHGKYCSCDCNSEEQVICGTDGNWYSDCTLECKQCRSPEDNVEASTNGTCKPKSEKRPKGLKHFFQNLFGRSFEDKMDEEIGNRTEAGNGTTTEAESGSTTESVLMPETTAEPDYLE